MIQNILEEKRVAKYLESRGLMKQYKKAKEYLLSENFQIVNFKLRKPKEAGIYSFRINKQFRALSILKNNTLRVFAIDNHQ